MSSRTAAARKRITTGEEKKPSSKGFFKKKSSSASKESRNETRSSHEQYAQYALVPDHSQTNYGDIYREHQGISSPHSQFQDQAYHHALQFTPTSPHMNKDSSYQLRSPSGPDYLEASYQPPPPSRGKANLQPHSSTTSYSKPMAKSPLHLNVLSPPSETDVLSAFPPPPSYASPVLSPTPALEFRPGSSASNQSSRLPYLPKRVSPTPTFGTELPAYSNSQSSDLTSQTSSGGHPSSQFSSVRPQYQQYLEQWDPPAPLVDTRPASAPRDSSITQQFKSMALGPQSPASFSFANRRTTTPTPWVPTQQAESIISVSSSESGGNATSDRNLDTPTSFVFPGSRSTGRPKVSETTGTPKIRLKGKSRLRNHSNGSNGSLPDGSAIDRRAASPTPSSSSSGLSIRRAGPMVPAVSSPKSRFSDDSGKLVSSKKSTPSSLSDSSSSNFVFPSSRSRAAPGKPVAKFEFKSRKRSGTRSSGSGSVDRTERTKFMGIPFKKKKKDKAGDGSSRSSQENETSQPQPAPPVLRVGEYPLDPFDPLLLDNDRTTGRLLSLLNTSDSPTFFHYGNMPPVAVLDLGCGQGDWMVEAAIAWKGYGTKFTGFDMVDITRSMLPWAVKHGVTENINFVKGNFLKQRLPFEDSSFDLVRMSCLALCISHESWPFVLKEVSRVLMVGGRLELIDDLVLFPYGKSSSIIDDPSSNSQPPLGPASQLNITIPSTAASTFALANSEMRNPGLGLSIDDSDPEDFYKLYEVEEEPDVDDAATINGDSLRPTFTSAPTPKDPRASGSTEVTSTSWHRAHATSTDLEALFQHMLVHKFGIQDQPMLDQLQNVFGHAREVKAMHIALAPPEDPQPGPRAGSGSKRFSSVSQLVHCPGLVVWPSTFIPMDRSEIEVHASKHLRVLLSCKNYLVEHALEAIDDDEVDQESVFEALWEYERFLRLRFNSPPDASESDSSRCSVVESVCTDVREDMWDIQSEFREHFMWQDNGSDASLEPATPKSPVQADHPHRVSVSTITHPPAASSNTSTHAKSSPHFSLEDLTHIRTFRVYEAIKMDNSIFGPAN